MAGSRRRTLPAEAAGRVWIRQRRRIPIARLVIALGAGLLLAYVVIWARVDWRDQGRADYGNQYVGGQLLRDGHRGDLYDAALQLAYHQRAIAPDSEGNLPFVSAPPSAVLSVPLTVLPLRTAWRVFSLFQAAMVGLAVVVAVRAAPWPARAPLDRRTAVLLAALASAPTEVVLLQGQWDGVFALGVALGYRELRRGRNVLGALLMVTPMLAIKPNLGLGLVAFLAGFGGRRVWAAVSSAAAAVLGASLLIGGPQVVRGFVSAALATRDQFPARDMNGFSGLTATWFGDGRLATALGLAGCLAAAVAAVPLGRAARRPALLEPALAGALALGLLASPYLHLHDVVVLVPAAAWMAPWAMARPGPARNRRAASPWLPALAVLWVGITAVASYEMTGSSHFGPLGRAMPWLFIAAGAGAYLGCGLMPRRRPASRAAPTVA